MHPALRGWLTVLPFVGACRLDAQLGSRAAAATISPDAIEHTIRVLAHDSMEGRATPSAGLDRAAAFLAREFARAGLEPAGDSSNFVWRYHLEEGALTPEGAALTVGGRRFALGSDAQLIFDHFASSRAEGRLIVLAGTEVVPDELHRAALRNQAVILVHGIDTATNRLRASLNGPVMLQNPSIIIVPNDRPDSLRFKLRANLSGPVQQLAAARIHGPHNHAIVEVSRRDLHSLLATTGFDLAAAFGRAGQRLTFTPVPLAARLDLPRRITSTSDVPNVVGLVRGSDPSLRNEYVVVMAHLDHLGVGPAVDGDTIYNGADDNASGTAALLEVARALAKMPSRPKRSVLFLATSGEEVGQHGGLAFLQSPPVRLGSIVAAINVDGVGKPGKGDSIAVLGRSYSTLGTTVDGVLREHGGLGFTAALEDKAFVQRGDHINFAGQGIPSVSLFSGGLQPYYHQPDDDADVIDRDFVTRVARLAFHLALAVANDSGRPKWHAGGSESMWYAR